MSGSTAGAALVLTLALAAGCTQPSGVASQAARRGSANRRAPANVNANVDPAAPPAAPRTAAAPVASGPEPL
jgi:hypothetical protein